jgi:GNAT superfamily N-acetyltransferase
VPLRRGSGADANGIGRVHALSQRAAYQEFIPADALSSITPESHAAYWQDRLEKEPEPHSIHVIEEKEVVQGFAMGSGRHRTATLNAIHLMPELRGTGAGRALHDALIDDFVAWNCTTAQLWVLEGNTHAQAFYVRRGWRRDDVREVQAFGGVDMTIVRFSRSLEG